MASVLANPFQKATRAKSRLRMALCGPAGSGKSYTALRFAITLQNLIRERTGREAKIAAIDTENGSLSKYSGETEDGMVMDFDCVDLQNFSPTSYVQMIKIAEQSGYEILVIDSLSHAWTGTGGALDMVDKKKAAGKNAFTDGWRDVTPMHNAMVDAIVAAKLHVIATMRTKTEWVMEPDPKTGKVAPRKIGLAPIQRAGLEYEFDIVGDIDQETHTLTVTKSRCKVIDNAIVTRPGAHFFAPIFSWLENGSDVPREIIDAAGFKTKEDPLTPMERAKRQKEEAAKRKAEQEAAAVDQPSSPQSSGGEVAGITEKTRGDIRSILMDICPDRTDAIELSRSLLSQFEVSTVAELSERDGQTIYTQLLRLKSERMREAADAKLAASGTSRTVDHEPSAVKTPPPPQTPPVPPEAAPVAAAPAEEAPPPSADDSGDARDLSQEPGTATKEQIAHCQSLAQKLGWEHAKQLEFLERMKCKSFRNLSEFQMDDLLVKLEKRLAASKAAA